MILKKLGIILIVLMFVGCVPSTEKNIGDEDRNLPIPESFSKDIQVEAIEKITSVPEDAYGNAVKSYMPIFSPDAEDTLLGKTEEEIIKILGSTEPNYVVTSKDILKDESYPYSLWVYVVAKDAPTALYLVFNGEASKKVVCEYIVDEFNGIIGHGSQLPFYFEGSSYYKFSENSNIRYIYTLENASYRTLKADSPLIKESLAGYPAIDIIDSFEGRPKYRYEVEIQATPYINREILIYPIEGNEETKYLNLLIEYKNSKNTVLSSWISEKLTADEYIAILDSK